MSDPAGLTARIFFALWPDAALRARLLEAQGRLHDNFGGRRMRPDTLHLTLLFVGAWPCEGLDELVQRAGEIRFPPLGLSLNRAECWPHNRIVSLVATDTDPAIAGLVGELKSRVHALGGVCERRPFTPHVTLLRHAQCGEPAPAIVPIHWTAQEFVLVESRLSSRGPDYRTLARWSAE